MDIFKDQSVLITGGTGSFGKAFAKKILSTTRCRKVIIFSRDEWKQWEMRQIDPVYNDRRIRYFIGSIRDTSRLMRAFRDVDIIIHAAALKQVPVAEYNPTEFVSTNVIGSMNIINAAIDSKVKKVIALSTDKAVNPVNLYGATKLCADKLFIAGNSYVGVQRFPIFSIVRYGNVLDSRGSILPMWKGMIEQGAELLPITDEKMTRFWITLDQAVQFVIKALPLSRGGEIFIPKIPSMKIVDLAKAIAPTLPHTVIGKREGEKLHELMISVEDGSHTLEFDDHYIIVPEIFLSRPSLLKKFLAGRKGKAPPKNFSYASNTNSRWMQAEELKKVLNL
ncbi:MAG: UDP-N-acetylglucosamine 4,6-dehydratase (inverting) [Waddliaceae bacterium]